MNINPLSFGRKIPINQIRVLDKEQNKFAEATFYEYDCKDLQDVAEVCSLNDYWSFASIVSEGMHKQYLCNFVNMPNSKLHYYCVKNDRNEIIGLCATEENNDGITVKFLESQPFSKFKYVGQSMLSSLAQMVLASGKDKLEIKGALSDVRDFYEKKCGFRPSKSERENLKSRFEMNRSEMPEFINRIKNKVSS